MTALQTLFSRSAIAKRNSSHAGPTAKMRAAIQQAASMCSRVYNLHGAADPNGAVFVNHSDIPARTEGQP